MANRTARAPTRTAPRARPIVHQDGWATMRPSTPTTAIVIAERTTSRTGTGEGSRLGMAGTYVRRRGRPSRRDTGQWYGILHIGSVAAPRRERRAHTDPPDPGGGWNDLSDTTTTQES